MSHVDDRVTQLSASLSEAALPHECYHDCVFVGIPGGQLEVKFWEDGSESVQLVHGDFNTHLEILALELELGEEEAFVLFVGEILGGERPVIHETSQEGAVRVTIEQSLEEYVKHVPAGTTYRVLNAT